MDTLRLVHSGNRVEFNTVNFVESRLWRPCCFGPVHTGNKVERTFNIRSTKATELATVLTATSCRIQIVADLLPKPYKQQSTVESRLLPKLATNLQQSRPCWIQRCRQCVPVFTVKFFGTSRWSPRRHQYVWHCPAALRPLGWTSQPLTD